MQTDNFKLFVKDEDFKMKIYKIAEFVEKYLKKKYPKEEFKIILDYDGIDERAVIRIVFKKKLKMTKNTEKEIDRINEIIDNVSLRCHEKFNELMYYVLVTSDLEVL
ncbi:conserved hypothetical protein [Methanocaldococcus sp. FS406-22]|uniref:hypothetical protein n=1 Tax=Methanocaldococcus sp. (strain FS406-22) TaxID=644281 RepID=UPI0001BF2FB0|nr:hypothetical protein [Methanocaldococcus sp. FS406-22]ADC69833.1 conserved hypothetical protein [Methanocaldococcus sp. FS406-22]